MFHPRATWANVLANAQGPNLFVYIGHGIGWPSPYAPDRPASAGTYAYKVRAIAAAGNKSPFSPVIHSPAVKGPLP